MYTCSTLVCDGVHSGIFGGLSGSVWEFMGRKKKNLAGLYAEVQCMFAGTVAFF